jgi:hypothetical protein
MIDESQVVGPSGPAGAVGSQALVPVAAPAGSVPGYSSATGPVPG